VSKASCWRYVGYMYENDQSLKTIDSTRYYCSLCLGEQKKLGSFHISKVSSFSIATSTGNINKHLLDKHETVVDSTQNNIPLMLNYLARHRQNFGSTSSSAAVVDRTQHEFNRDVVVWFVRDLLAFENIPKAGMIDFMRKNMPSVTLPTPETLAGTALNDCMLL
jgi:hypothetical protein